MRKPSFLDYDKPLITAMVTEADPESAAVKIEEALADGAEAFGIQLDCLKREYRNEEALRHIFAACDGNPIYITSYRNSQSEGMTDDECVELLMLGLKTGATLCDVMGDMFHREPWELTREEAAVEKQRALIKRIHDMGGEVLISSHLHAFFDEDTVFGFARSQAERGADIVKIVTFAQTEDQLITDLKIIKRMKSVLNKPFLFLANGEKCHLLRQIGPKLGVCMYLCRTSEGCEQPTVKTVKYLRDELWENFNCDPCRQLK